MRAQFWAIAGMVCLLLACQVGAEELQLRVTLQDFSGDNVRQRVNDAAQGRGGSVTSIVGTLKPGKVLFSQILDVADGQTLKETILVEDTTIEFRCKLGKLQEDKLVAGVEFSMTKSQDPSKGETVQLFQAGSGGLRLTVGEKTYGGGAYGDNDARLLVLELSRPERK